jgi:hypothetical protein
MLTLSFIPRLAFTKADVVGARFVCGGMPLPASAI